MSKEEKGMIHRLPQAVPRAPATVTLHLVAGKVEAGPCTKHKMAFLALHRVTPTNSTKDFSNSRSASDEHQHKSLTTLTTGDLHGEPPNKVNVSSNL